MSSQTFLLVSVEGHHQQRRFLPAGRANLGRGPEHDNEVLRVGYRRRVDGGPAGKYLATIENGYPSATSALSDERPLLKVMQVQCDWPLRQAAAGYDQEDAFATFWREIAELLTDAPLHRQTQTSGLWAHRK